MTNPTELAPNGLGVGAAVSNENGAQEQYLSDPQISRAKNEYCRSAGFFPNFLACYRSRAMWAHKCLDPSQYVGKGGLSQTPTNNIHFQLKNIPRRACSVILSFKLYIICADSGISTRLHSYGAGKYMRISLFLFGMYMVTSIDIKFYLHYGVDEQVSNKAGLPHLVGKKFTALKAGRCLLLITAQPG